MDTSHFRDVCQVHGRVLAQCRCPGPKTDRLVPCQCPPGAVTSTVSEFERNAQRRDAQLAHLRTLVQLSVNLKSAAAQVTAAVVPLLPRRPELVEPLQSEDSLVLAHLAGRQHGGAGLQPWQVAATMRAEVDEVAAAFDRLVAHGLAYRDRTVMEQPYRLTSEGAATLAAAAAVILPNPQAD